MLGRLLLMHMYSSVPSVINLVFLSPPARIQGTFFRRFQTQWSVVFLAFPLNPNTLESFYYFGILLNHMLDLILFSMSLNSPFIFPIFLCYSVFLFWVIYFSSLILSSAVYNLLCDPSFLMTHFSLLMFPVPSSPFFLAF